MHFIVTLKFLKVEFKILKKHCLIFCDIVNKINFYFNYIFPNNNLFQQAASMTYADSRVIASPTFSLTNSNKKKSSGAGGNHANADDDFEMNTKKSLSSMKNRKFSFSGYSIKVKKFNLYFTGKIYRGMLSKNLWYK